MGDTKKTLIEEGTEFKGTLTSTCAIVVMGRVEGEMKGPSVEVTETGVLSGKAKVTELRSRGELSGEFDAEVVELSGRVRDKTVIRAKSLEVSLQRSEGGIGMVFGDCELAVGEAPDKARAVREATSGRQDNKGSKDAREPAAPPAAPIAQACAAPAPAAPDAGGGEVTGEADMSASARLRRGKRPGEVERLPESA
ncbi:MAG TPA: polymer-forming cytoskeletal protein [Polyangia bacterium]|nr:polymer-forming cytoskeletal protein [Polyangia bacterium]